MSAPVFIAGVGAVSAIGNNVTESLTALEKERAGMGAMQWLDSVHGATLPVAEVKQSNEQLAATLQLSSVISRTAMLGMLAAKEALHNAGIHDPAAFRTGLVSANTVGGMDRTEHFFRDFIKDKKKGRLRDVIYHECGYVTEQVADHLGIRDHVTTISTACSSSANAIFYGARLIRNNILDVVVAGGADALTKFTLNGFNTLMILDPEYCRPFDENRKGLNLGEGAGYLVMVSEKVAAKLNQAPDCKLTGYGNANDAYHQTASSPEGTGSFLAMKGALAKSGLEPADISYINLHGTGTQNNDIAEGTAIKRLFHPLYPKMSSTKSFTGHTLGASGGLEAVFSILAMRAHTVFPNLRLQTPMADLPFVPETTLTKNFSIRHVLSNSFGFGGNCSSLIFSKFKMKAFIRATGNISPQKTFGHPPFLSEPVDHKANRLNCIEPDYKAFIDVKQIRRMSRVIKMGVAAAMECLAEAGVAIPDAIVTGTAYGCLEDTGIFLSKMIEQQEQLLAPTAFIQSTHNTVGAQIALMLHCNGYNNVFVHRDFSFESALLDAMMLLKEGDATNVLAGGLDETTDMSHAILSRFGLYKKNFISSLHLFDNASGGTIAGEGASFFLLTDQPGINNYAQLHAPGTCYRPVDIRETERHILSFLAEHSMLPEHIDLVIYGRNGDAKGDKIYDEIAGLVFSNNFSVNYKQLCGEYPTSVSFALWLAANIIRSASIPEVLGYKGDKAKAIKNILIYNHSQDIRHSLLLVTAC